MGETTAGGGSRFGVGLKVNPRHNLGSYNISVLFWKQRRIRNVLQLTILARYGQWISWWTFKMAITTTFAIRRIGTLFLFLVIALVRLVTQKSVISQLWNTLGINASAEFVSLHSQSFCHTHFLTAMNELRPNSQGLCISLHHDHFKTFPRSPATARKLIFFRPPIWTSAGFLTSCCGVSGAGLKLAWLWLSPDAVGRDDLSDYVT